MDVYCPVCGEPVDIAEFHYVEAMTYKQAYRGFQKIGCAIFGGRHNPDGLKDKAEQAREVYALLGDDVDSAASMLDEV